MAPMCRAQVKEGVYTLCKRWAHEVVVPRKATAFLLFKERKGKRHPVGSRWIYTPVFHTPNSRGIPLNLISKYPSKGVTEYNIEYK